MPKLRPCVQYPNYCHGCTSACVEVSACPECNAGKNRQCEPTCPDRIETVTYLATLRGDDA